MQIELTKEHELWLREQVASGRFASADDAIRFAIEAVAASGADEDDDEMLWAKPLIEQGIADVEAGRTVSHEDVFRHLRDLLNEKPR
jgi:antitoxin ParD1/3/4